MQPDVSVVLPAWNAEATIGRAVTSALDQSGIGVEVLLVDDCSDDATVPAARAASGGDPRLRILRQSANAGPGAARNRALSEAVGTWVTPLDADDAMRPDRLRRLRDIAVEEDADFVADDLLRQAEGDTGGGHARRLWSDEPIGRRRLSAAEFVRANLTDRHGDRRELGFVKPLMSRAFLRNHALTYPDLRLGEDYALYTAALLAGARFVLTDPAGYVSILRDGSLSREIATEAHGALVAVDTELLGRTDDPEARRALRAHRRAAQKEWAWRRLIDAKRLSDPRAALACFWAPPAIAADLSRKLVAEAGMRARQKLGRG